MAFQSTVSTLQGFGVPGDIFQDVPWIALSYILESGAEPNVVGSTAYTITSDGVAQAGNGGTFGFAGILGSPKSYSLFGTGGSPLAPTLILPNYTQGELFTQGMMIVTLPAAANIGDYVLYNDTTGALASMPPGDTATTGYSFANAIVSQFTQSTAGTALAVIQIIPVINPIPTNE